MASRRELLLKGRELSQAVLDGKLAEDELTPKGQTLLNLGRGQLRFGDLTDEDIDLVGLDRTVMESLGKGARDLTKAAPSLTRASMAPVFAAGRGIAKAAEGVTRAVTEPWQAGGASSEGALPPQRTGTPYQEQLEAFERARTEPGVVEGILQRALAYPPGARVTAPVDPVQLGVRVLERGTNMALAPFGALAEQAAENMPRLVGGEPVSTPLSRFGQSVPDIVANVLPFLKAPGVRAPSYRVPGKKPWLAEETVRPEATPYDYRQGGPPTGGTAPWHGADDNTFPRMDVDPNFPVDPGEALAPRVPTRAERFRGDAPGAPTSVPRRPDFRRVPPEARTRSMLPSAERRALPPGRGGEPETIADFEAPPAPEVLRDRERLRQFQQRARERTRPDPYEPPPGWEPPPPDPPALPSGPDGPRALPQGPDPRALPPRPGWPKVPMPERESPIPLPAGRPAPSPLPDADKAPKPVKPAAGRLPSRGTLRQHRMAQLDLNTVNTRDYDEVASLIRGLGGLAPGGDFEGLPRALLSKKGRQALAWDELVANIAEAQGRRNAHVERDLMRTLRKGRGKKVDERAEWEAHEAAKQAEADRKAFEFFDDPANEPPDPALAPNWARPSQGSRGPGDSRLASYLPPLPVPGPEEEERGTLVGYLKQAAQVLGLSLPVVGMAYRKWNRTRGKARPGGAEPELPFREGEPEKPVGRQQPLAPGTSILARFPGEEGTEAVVAKIDRGYSVVLRDTEAGEAVGAARIFPTEAQAMARAQEIAAGKAPLRDAQPPVAAGATPKFERTATGESQALVPGAPKRQMPTTATRASARQKDVEDTPLFGQERAAAIEQAKRDQGNLFDAPPAGNEPATSRPAATTAESPRREPVVSGRESALRERWAAFVGDPEIADLVDAYLETASKIYRGGVGDSLKALDEQRRRIHDAILSRWAAVAGEDKNNLAAMIARSRLEAMLERRLPGTRPEPLAPPPTRGRQQGLDLPGEDRVDRGGQGRLLGLSAATVGAGSLPAIEEAFRGEEPDREPGPMLAGWLGYRPPRPPRVPGRMPEPPRPVPPREPSVPGRGPRVQAPAGAGAGPVEPPPGVTPPRAAEPVPPALGTAGPGEPPLGPPPGPGEIRVPTPPPDSGDLGIMGYPRHKLRQYAKPIFERFAGMGEAGREIGRRAMNYYGDQDRFTGRHEPMLRAVNRLNNAEAENLRLALEEGAEPMNPKVRLAYEQARRALNSPDSETIRGAQQRNLIILDDQGQARPWQPRQNFYPHEYTPDFRREVLQEGTPERSRSIRWLIDHGHATDADQAAAILADRFGARQVTIGDRVFFLDPDRYVGGLERAREINLPGYITDPRVAIEMRLRKVGRRFAELDHFGRLDAEIGAPGSAFDPMTGDRVPAHGLIGRIQRERGVPAAEQAFDMFHQILGHRTRDDFAGQSFARMATSLEAMFRLPWAMAQNASQPVLGMIRTNISTGLKGIGRSLGRGGKDAGRELGVISRGALRDFWAEQTGQAGLTRWAERSPGIKAFNAQEDINRAISANMGKLWAERLQRELGSPRGRTQAWIDRELTSLHFSPEEIARIRREGVLTPEDRARVAWGIVEQSLGRPTAAQRSQVFNTSLGRVVGQFHQFAIRSGYALKRAVVDEARAGNWAPFARLVAAFPLAGELVQDIRAVINGTERPESWAGRMLDNMLAVAGFGMAVNVMQSYERQGPLGVLSYAAGPFPTDVLRAGQQVGQLGYAAVADRENLGKQAWDVAEFGARFVAPPLANRMRDDPAGKARERLTVPQRLGMDPDFNAQRDVTREDQRGQRAQAAANERAAAGDYDGALNDLRAFNERHGTRYRLDPDVIRRKRREATMGETERRRRQTSPGARPLLPPVPVWQR